jgi:sulfur-carrier protein
MATLIIPTPLRKFTENQATLKTDSETVFSSIKDLTARYPELHKHLLDEDGSIRKFVKIFVGDEDIKALDNENTKVGNDTIISIIPAIAGGSK